jgi:tRNA (mo5U34)-methyltransferase
MGWTPSYDEVASHYWFHSIDLGNGIVTPGDKPLEDMQIEFALAFDSLDLRGKTVLDVGAWNGAFSIEAKRRGAKRVIALDHETWNHPEFRGRQAFELAVRACGVGVEAFDQDLDSPQLSFDALLSFANLPAFDIVLYFGVFYHLKDPLAATRELASIAREAMVLETHLEVFPDERPTMLFYPGTELAGDSTNWWGPNRACVEHLLKLYGFQQIGFAVNRTARDHFRGFFHAYKRAHSLRQPVPGFRVSRSDVIEAYQCVLGREPESEQAIREHMEAGSISELYRGLIESEEFRQAFVNSLDEAVPPAVAVTSTADRRGPRKPRSP